MRRLTVAAGVTLLLLASPVAFAQQPKKATIRGSVIHGKTGRPVASAEVRVIGARSDGSGRVFEDTGTTGKDGSYSFEVSVRPGLEFALEAEYDNGLFVGDSVQVEKGEQVVDIEVWDTTSDPSVITVTGDQMVIAQDESNTGVLELVSVQNESDRAYIGRGESMGAASDEQSPTLGFSLPSQAIGQPIELIDSSLNRLYAVDASFGFAATVAIPPGETSATFRYLVSGVGGRYDLTKRALYPTESVSVLATEPLEIDSPRLQDEGIEKIGKENYRKWSSTNLFDAGDSIPVLAVAEGSASSSLWVGMLVGLGIMLILGAAGIAMRKRANPTPKVKPARARPRSTQVLVSAIAELDLKHDGGELSDQEWSEQRARLKSQLIDAKQREPAS